MKLIEPYVNWVQLDVADGTFTKNTTWHNAKDLSFLETPLKIELHLMIDNIERRIEEWLLPNVQRVIFHISAASNPGFVITKCWEKEKEAGIAVGPDESLVSALQYKDEIRFYQILAVHPGLAGQELLPESFERIKELKKICPSCIIEVDGGMNEETAKKAVEAGADIICSASYIFNSDNIKQAIEKLRSI